jgi:hypothetical protein
MPLRASYPLSRHHVTGCAASGVINLDTVLGGLATGALFLLRGAVLVVVKTAQGVRAVPAIGVDARATRLIRLRFNWFLGGHFSVQWAGRSCSPACDATMSDRVAVRPQW